MKIFLLKGRIYSKKNSRRMIKRGTRMFFVPSKPYEIFQKAAVKQLQDQIGKDLAKPLFAGPVSVHTEIFIPGRIRVDADNLHTSLLDCLEAAKVIADDNNVLIGSYKKYNNMDAWGANIMVKDLTTGDIQKFQEKGEIYEPNRAFAN